MRAFLCLAVYQSVFGILDNVHKDLHQFPGIGIDFRISHKICLKSDIVVVKAVFDDSKGLFHSLAHIDV